MARVLNTPLVNALFSGPFYSRNARSLTRNDRLSVVILATLAFCLVATGGFSQTGTVLYENGPIHQTQNGGDADIGFYHSASNTFTLIQDSTITGFDIGTAEYENDTALTIKWTVSDQSGGGGHVYASGTAHVTDSFYSWEWETMGFKNCKVSWSIPSLRLPVGTYWLTLQGVTTSLHSTIWWMWSSGGCHSFGCPSQSWFDGVTISSSEVFDVRGLAATDPATNFVDNTNSQVVQVQQTGTGVALNASAAGNTAVAGVSGATPVPHVLAGVEGVSGLDGGFGVYGRATSPSATRPGIGVFGGSDSPTGVGIFATATGSANTIGLVSMATSTGGIAIDATETATSGNTIGVVARVYSSTGIGLLVLNNAPGPVTGSLVSAQTLQGIQFSVDGSGNALFSGRLTARGSYNTPISNGVPAYIGSDGKLGTLSSSRRFKEQISDMGQSSSALLNLRPVTFLYKPEYDQGLRTLQYGLIAEEVAQVYPGLVVYDSDGQPYAVKYQYLAPMLLNELQKERAVVSAQQTVIEKLQAQNEEMQQRLSRLEQLVTRVSK